MLNRFFRLCLVAPLLSPRASQEAHAYSACGTCSWYGAEFEGQRTANGERFSSAAMTAAHRHFAFGTRLKVTNQANGRSVTIRVNDSGPYFGGRVLDLSRGAFSRIASVGQGVADVCYRVV
jgi:rare lipoprotein A